MRIHLIIGILLASFDTVLAKTTLRVGLVEGGPMTVIKADDPNPGGASPIFLNAYVFPEIKKKFDVRVVWDLSPASRLFKELASGRLDMLCFVVKTPEREKLFNFSSVDMFKEAGGLIVRKDFVPNQDTVNPKDLSGKTIGQLNGTYMPEFYQQYKIKSYQISGEDVSQRISDLVDSKRIDGAFIHVYATAQYLVKKSNAKSIKAVRLLESPPFSVTVAYRKDLDPTLKNSIDDSLRKHKGRFDEIVKSLVK